MAVDSGSAAAVALVSRVAAAGGGLLYREAVTADDRMPELMAMAATLAADVGIPRKVAVHDRYGAGLPSLPPVAAVIGAVLHGVVIVVIANPIIEATCAVDDYAEDEPEDSRSKRPAFSALTHDGWKLASLMPHIPVAVLVPIPHDVVLAPRAAACFITAIGPLRRDRHVAKTHIKEMSNGHMSDEVADRVADLWDGNFERAQTAIQAVDRMINGPLRSRRSFNVVKARTPSRPPVLAAFTAMTEALAGGIAPHVWAPIKPQRRPKPAIFHRELFICEPEASILFLNVFGASQVFE